MLIASSESLIIMLMLWPIVMWNWLNVHVWTECLKPGTEDFLCHVKLAREHSVSMVSCNSFLVLTLLTPVPCLKQTSPPSQHQFTNQNAQPMVQSPQFTNLDPRSLSASSHPLLHANGHHHPESRLLSPIVLPPNKILFTPNGSLTPYNQPLSIKIQSPPLTVTSQSLSK